MKNLYVISGVTGMTGSELSRQFVSQGHTVIGFDNFFASSIDTVKDIIDNPSFIFYNYDINKVAQMYNPQIQISAESETKRSIFREKDKTKRSKKESAQHSKSRNKSFVMTSVSAL